MMQTYRYASDLQLDVSGEANGNYNVYVWTFEDSSSLNATLSVNGVIVLPSYDTGAVGHWSKLGPYPATVTNGHIVVHWVCNAPSGDQGLLAGIEIWSTSSVSPTPTPTPTPTPRPSATPPLKPIYSVSASPGQVTEGNDATFTISTSMVLPSDVTLTYSMGGRATFGVDYTMSGTPGQVTIPAGQTTATVVLHSLADLIHEKNEAATMTLRSTSFYKLPRRPSATVTIINVGP